MENWADIPGFTGRYQVSDLGRVRSVDQVIISKNRIYRWKGKILSPGPTHSGHVSVALGRRNSRSVHTLVMLTFVGPPPIGMEVLHRNERPADNRLVNLKYGTRSENMKMDYASGVRATPLAFIDSANGKRHKGKNAPYHG